MREPSININFRPAPTLSGKIRTPKSKAFVGKRSAAQFARYYINSNHLFNTYKKACEALESGSDNDFFQAVADYQALEKYFLEGVL